MLYYCGICKRSFKTVRGKERHELSAHNESSVEIMDSSSWHSIIKSAINKVIEELIEEIKSFLLVDINNDCRCIEDFSASFKYVNELEKFFPMFYSMVTKKDSIHNLSKDSSVAVGFEMANEVILHYKNKDLPTQSTSTCSLSDRDVTVVVYVSGYVFSNLYRKLRKSSKWETEIVQQKLTILKAGKTDPNDDEKYALIKCRDRGGLWYINDDVITIFMEAEKEFQHMSKQFSTKIPLKNIVDSICMSVTVKTSMKTLSESVNADEEFVDNFLEELVSFYVRVRSHSFAKDLKEKYKQANKITKGKALRSELKRSAAKD